MRLQAIDFLRGVALCIVLLDHIDILAGSGTFYRPWTLMGLGFSDAAEAFVFLSGLTFGWVYGERLARDGLVACQKRALRRTARIYAGYVAAVATVAALGFLLTDTDASLSPAIHLADRAELSDALAGALRLDYQPLGLGILCLYIVVLPFMPLLLALSRRCGWVALGISAALYAVVQIEPGLCLPRAMGNWPFNPFAWQFLMVAGAFFGLRARASEAVARRWIPGVILAGSVLIYGVFVRKLAPWLEISRLPTGLGSPFDIVQPGFTNKTDLAPLRLVHFAALAYLVQLATPRVESAWRGMWARPFILCGRNSLSVYCAGTVLAYLCVPIVRWAGATPTTLLIAGLDACVLQVCIAWIVDILARRRRGNAHRDLPSSIASRRLFR